MTHARRLVDSLLVPIYAAVVFVLLFAALSLVSSVYSWSDSYDPAVHLSLGWIVRQLPIATGRVLFASVVTTTFFLVYRIRKRPGLRLLSFLFALASSAALLYFGHIALDRLFSHRTAVAAPAHPFVPRRFELLGDTALYIEKVEGNRLLGVTLVRPGHDPAASVIPEAQFHPKEMTLTASGLLLAVSPPDPIYGPLFQAPPFLGSLFSDVGKVSNEVDGAFAASLRELAIVAGAILLFCMSCTMISRLSAWPLLNGFLTLLVFRGLFFALPLLSTNQAVAVEKQIGAALKVGAWERYLPSFALALLALLFILIDFTLLRRRTS